MVGKPYGTLLCVIIRISRKVKRILRVRLGVNEGESKYKILLFGKGLNGLSQRHPFNLSMQLEMVHGLAA